LSITEWQKYTGSTQSKNASQDQDNSRGPGLTIAETRLPGAFADNQ